MAKGLCIIGGFNFDDGLDFVGIHYDTVLDLDMPEKGSACDPERALGWVEREARSMTSFQT